MRLALLTRTIGAGDRLGSVLQRHDRLARRGLDALAAAGVVGEAEAVPAAQPAGHRRGVVTVTIAAVAVTAAGAGVYLWWRHRQAQERPDLQRPAQEPPGPVGPPPAVAEDGETEGIDVSADGALVGAVDAVDRQIGDRQAGEPAGEPAPEPAQAKQAEPPPATRSGGTGLQAQVSARPPRGQRKRGRASGGGLPRVPTFFGPQGWSELPAVAAAPPLPHSSGVATLRR